MMRNWKSQRGDGKLGCIVTIAVMAAFIYLSVKCVPVYLDKIEFEEELARVVSQAGAQALSPEALSKNVERIAELHEFEIVPGTLSSMRKPSVNAPPKMQIEVSYFRSVEFPGYIHRFVFSAKTSTYVGRL